MHRFGGKLVILCADSLRHRDTGAQRKSDEQINNQIGKRACGTHRSNRIAAAEPADHYQIRRIEKQL